MQLCRKYMKRLVFMSGLLFLKCLHSVRLIYEKFFKLFSCGNMSVEPVPRPIMSDIVFLFFGGFVWLLNAPSRGLTRRMRQRRKAAHVVVSDDWKS